MFVLAEISRRQTTPDEATHQQPPCDLTEAKALQLQGVARHVSAAGNDTISQKRQRLKRSRLNQSDSSGVHSISQDLIPEAPPQAKYVYSPRRALSQQSSGATSPSTSPARPSSYSYSHSMSHSLSYGDSFYRPGHGSPTRQPYEPKVIVTSSTNYGDATLRRSKKNRHRRQMTNDVDYNSLVQPYHTVRGKYSSKTLSLFITHCRRFMILSFFGSA